MTVHILQTGLYPDDHQIRGVFSSREKAGALAEKLRAAGVLQIRRNGEEALWVDEYELDEEPEKIGR